MPTTHFPDRKRGPLSAAEVREIERLAARGLTAGQIAGRMQRIPATINFAMHGLGLKTAVPRSFRYRRGEAEVRSFTPEEDAFIQGERERGLKLVEIAAAVDRRFGHWRTGATLSVRLRMLANAAEAAAGSRQVTP